MEQGDFVEGRQILDGIIVAHECLHTAHFQNQASFALKLDIAKAYDNVNWQFLLAILKKFGFGDLFCKWIKEMISTVSFSLLINGESSGFLDHPKA